MNSIKSADMKDQEINLSSIEHNIPQVSFDLFRFWVKEFDQKDTLIIKTEQRLIIDLKEAIIDAVKALHKTNDSDKKLAGWDIGFILGFIGGYLQRRWYHEYVEKNKEEYKVYAGLIALQGYLKANKVTEIQLDALYEEILSGNSNINYLDTSVNQLEIGNNHLKINQTPQK
ncbi:MAG: hypothetical protein D6730_18245, partial [Bacteroidetes bacterium]